MGHPVRKAAEIDFGQLVRRAQADDRGAFASLVEASQNRLFRFCMTLTADRVMSEDLCQEAYLRAFDRLKSLDKPGSFLDWLFRITKNLYLDYVRSRASKETSLEDTGGDTEGIDSQDLAEVLAVHAALSRFEPEDRYILLLVDLEERSYKEAADIMGISEDAVRSRLFRLRKLFLEKWQKPETK